MAKLYFSYSAMNAGKSAILLQASHNYRERGMDTFLLTAGIDKRAGEHVISSRLGLSADAQGFYQDTTNSSTQTPMCGLIQRFGPLL